MNPVEVVMLLFTIIISSCVALFKLPKLIRWIDKRVLLINARENKKKLIEEVNRICACGCGEVCTSEDVFDRQWWRRSCYRKLLGD